MMDFTTISNAKSKQGFDEGLRSYMLKIYNYMAMALLLTGVMAYGTLNFPPLMNLMYDIGSNGEFLGRSTLGTIITFAPLGIAIFFFMGMARMSVQTAQTTFWIYAALMGMSLSSLGLVYTGQSLARTFFICSAVFGSMSLYGYTTKRDLTSMGSFLVMGLIGLIVVTLINLFLQSPSNSFCYIIYRRCYLYGSYCLEHTEAKSYVLLIWWWRNGAKNVYHGCVHPVFRLYQFVLISTKILR